MSRESHEHEAQPTGESRILSVPLCPVCGTLLKLSLLHLKDEGADSTDLLLLLDCPTGDYHGTFTQEDITRIIADEVILRLR